MKYENKEYSIPVNYVIQTSGSGYWSKHARAVRVTELRLNVLYVENDSKGIGHLQVLFDTETWNTKKHGLIYTDKLFFEQLCNLLKIYKLPTEDIGYSEQGMQGKDFVDFDAGDNFVRAFINKVNN